MRQLTPAVPLTAATLLFSGCAYDEPRGDRGYRDDSCVNAETKKGATTAMIAESGDPMIVTKTGQGSVTTVSCLNAAHHVSWTLNI
jgi:hypothetical protein